MLPVACGSELGQARVNVRPASAVRHTPAPAVATNAVSGRDRSTAMLTTRPPMSVGPTKRHVPPTADDDATVFTRAGPCASAAAARSSPADANRALAIAA